jgi:hypothetical protein
LDSPWHLPGEWLKGALHVHTTNSDGRLTPQQAIDAYAACGYDFVVFSDHGKVTPPDSVNPNGMVVIGGAEVGAGRTELGATYHLLAVGLENLSDGDLDTSSAQAAVDGLRAMGAMVFVAHPYWSLLSEADLLAVECDGIEVFNAGCEYETQHGDGGQHWDWVLASGRRPLGVAVDDAHWGFGDWAGGWVMVRAAERSAPAVMAAMRAGHFYASAGPTLEDLGFAEDGLYVRCSPAAAIHMIRTGPGAGWTSRQSCERPPCPEVGTEAELPKPGPGAVFRIECVDSTGRKAWTNPMSINSEG